MTKETLNEEQLKQARKDAMTGFSEPVWVVSPKSASPGQCVAGPEGKVVDESSDPPFKFVEAERFIDARSFACRLFGVPEVVISRHVVPGRKPVPRWQVRFAGHAAGSNTLRMQSRQITDTCTDPKWVDTREL